MCALESLPQDPVPVHEIPKGGRDRLNQADILNAELPQRRAQHTP